jgi:monofunctional glycosyltransferase
VLSFFGSTIAMVFFYKWVNPPLTFLMIKRVVMATLQAQPNDLKYEFVPYPKISNHLKLAVIASEDQKFAYHLGFDLDAIGKALEKNKKSSKIVGASTISQQTAKNVFLWDGRNFVRKGLEAYFTCLIELIWGKKRILEVYLNVAEMGRLTFGAEAAGYRYFKKPARKMSKEQAALVAAVLPNPIYFKVKQPTKFILKRKNWITRQMNNLGEKYLKEFE